MSAHPFASTTWGNERYRYDVAFDAGSTNVRADQYAVVDPCEFVNLGIRLDTLVTPAAYGDTDGLVNVWYRTNMTDTSAVYSTASASPATPQSRWPTGTDRIGTVGCGFGGGASPPAPARRLDVDGSASPPANTSRESCSNTGRSR